MTNNCPSISVIMSVYNGEKYLRESIESILSQTFSDFEFIIVNDGSTDGSRDILSSFKDSRIRIIDQDNMGLTRSLNRALVLARGEFIARQDADDVSLPSRFEEQASYLLENRHVVLLGTGFIEIDENGTERKLITLPENDAIIRWNLLFDNCFCHTSVMMRTSVIRKHCLQYDENIKKAQDYGFWSTLLEYGAGANLQYPLLKYRVHGEQITVVHNQEQKNFAENISRNNLFKLGFNLSDDELKDIRLFNTKWYWCSDNYRLDAAALYGSIFALFLTKYPNSPEIINILKKRHLDKLCWCIGAGNFLASLNSGLLAVLLRIDKNFVVEHFWRRFVNKLTLGKLQSR